MLRDPTHRVSPRARWLWTIHAVVETLVLVAVLVVVEVLSPLDLPWWAWAALGVVATSYVVVEPRWRYRVHRWEVTDTAVYTQTGWWARERRIAPMSRIQTVDHAEGAIARLLELATVSVTTASAAGALEIAGLDAALARDLVEELTRKADAVEGDAT